MWRQQRNSNPVNWEVCAWIPGCVGIGEHAEYVSETGNSALLTLQMDIITVIEHFCPPSELGEFPVMESPLYCLTFLHLQIRSSFL